MGKPYFGASLTYNSKHTLRGLFSPFNLFHYALSHDDSYPFLLSQALRTNDCIVTRQSPFVSLTTGCSVLMFVIVFQQPKKQTNKQFKQKPLFVVCFVCYAFVTNCWTTNSDTPPRTKRMRLTWMGSHVLYSAGATCATQKAVCFLSLLRLLALDNIRSAPARCGNICFMPHGHPSAWTDSVFARIKY